MKKEKRAVIFGIFDGIHAGHRDFLQQAKAYGDELFAIVGRDESVVRLKGKSPTYPEKTRIELVAQEEWVSDVILGDEEPSSYRVLGELNPDVICLGYDQRALRADLEEWMRGRGQKIPMYSLEPYHPDTFHSSFLGGGGQLYISHDLSQIPTRGGGQ